MPVNAIDEASPLLLHTRYDNNGTDNVNDGDEEKLNVTPPVPPDRHTPQQQDYWENYVMIVEKKPLLVKSVTATIIMGGADLIAQGVEHWRGTSTMTMPDSDSNSNNNNNSAAAIFDGIRVLRFAAFGLFGAPWSHYYFHWLDHFLPPTNEPWTRTTLIKLGIDQFIQAPLLLAIMISLLSIMKGGGFKSVQNDLGDNFLDALIANWKLWIPASAVNLAFVKPTLRVLYVNVVFMFWTVILSLMLNKSN